MSLSVKNRMQTHAVIPTERLGSQLDDEEQDPRDGHGAASSPGDFCCGQGEGPGCFRGAQTTASLGPGEGCARETWCLCWAENGRCHFPPLHLPLHPCWRAFWGASVGSSRAFARSLEKQFVKAGRGMLRGAENRSFPLSGAALSWRWCGCGVVELMGYVALLR